MTCKKCNSIQIKIIQKNSGQKLYHCKDCGYNFSETEFFHKTGDMVTYSENSRYYSEFDLYKFFSKPLQKLFIKPDTNSIFAEILEILFNLIGFIIGVLAIAFFGALITSSLDLVVMNTKYGQIGALIAGFLLFSLSPIFYVFFMKSLFNNREGLFSPNKIGFFKRFGYFLIATCLGIFNLFLVGLMILFVPAATKDIITGPKIECLAFVRILEEQTSRGSNGARIYKNYVEFKRQNGEVKKLADLKLDYTKISAGRTICFDKFESLNIYSGDRLEQN